jgi:cytochrome d ubiquinol oxidase subunit I
MQTPAGFEIRDGLFHAVDWVKVIFNPSFPTRFMHMVSAAYLTTGFAVLGAAGWLWLRGRDDAETRVMRRMAIGMIVLLAPLQLMIGHESGKVTEEYQPAKVAAMEGWWQTRAGQPSLLFALPDQEGERNRFEFGIPRFGSWVVAGDFNAELHGLDAFAPEDRPPVAWVFWGFRVMVGLGMAMIAMGLWGAWLWWRGRLEKSRLYQMAAFAMAPAGFIAVLAGWISAEVGRQPWTVYGVLRTADSVSPVSSGQVTSSLLVFMIVYAIVFSAGSLYILRLVTRGPGGGEKPMERGHQAGRNPLAGVEDESGTGRGAS